MPRPARPPRARPGGLALTALALLALSTALAPACRPGGARGAAGGPPLGTYDIERPSGDAAGAPAERWVLALAEGGRFTVTRNGQVAVEGQYRVAADTIVFSGESGPIACPDAETGPGVYRWRLGERDLTLTPLADRCDGRRNIVTAGPLAREGAGGAP